MKTEINADNVAIAGNSSVTCATGLTVDSWDTQVPEIVPFDESSNDFVFTEIKDEFLDVTEFKNEYCIGVKEEEVDEEYGTSAVHVRLCFLTIIIIIIIIKFLK